jgi:hypothetical protein
MSQPLYPTPHFPAAPANEPRTPWVAARLAVGGLAACAITGVLLTIVSVADNEQTVAALRDGGEAGFGPLQVVALGVIGIYLLALAFAAVTFIVWLYQARSNTDRLNGGAEWAKGWTIGAWFIPLANLVIPFKVVDDVRDASTPYVPDLDAAPVRRAPVGQWWAAVIAVGVLDRISSTHDNALLRAGDPTLASMLDSRPTTYALMAASSAALVAAAVLGSVVVLRIMAAQDKSAELQAAP